MDQFQFELVVHKTKIPLRIFQDNFHDFLMENNESLNMPVLESVYFLLNQTKNEFFKEQIKVTLFTIEMS